MSSSRKMIAVAVMAMFCSAAWSADQVAEEIRQLNEQIALKSARLRELEVRAQIATKQAELERTGGAASAPTGQPADLPVVRGIEGIDGKMKATLAFAGGIQQTVSQGEKVHGGWSVGSIEIAAVTLIKGSERLRLGFGREPPATPPSFPGAPAQGPYPAPRGGVGQR